MSQTEAAIRRAGALAALATASALMRFPAAEHVVLALHAVFLLGCAAVQLSPVHRAVANLAHRAAEAARGMALGASAAGLRWVGFAGIVLYALYATGDVRTEAEAELGKFEDFLLFLMFLAGVWAVYLSMVTGRGSPTPRPAAAAEEGINSGEVDAMEATREILAVPWLAETELRWVGFTGMVVYAVYVVGDVRKEPAAAKEEVSVDKVNGLVLFLVFVAGVLTVNLSMLTGKASEPATPPPLPAAAKEEVSVDKVNGLLLFLVFLAGVLTVNLSITGRASEPVPPPPLPPPPPPPPPAAEEQLGSGEVNVMLPSSVRADDPEVRKIKEQVRSFLLFLVFLAGVWAVHLSMVNGRGAPRPRPAAATAEEEELDGGEVNAMAPRSARVVVDSKL